MPAPALELGLGTLNQVLERENIGLCGYRSLAAGVSRGAQMIAKLRTPSYRKSARRLFGRFSSWEFLSLTVTLWYSFLVAKFGYGSFATNDDFSMLLFANGEYTGEPESQLAFISKPLGELMGFLYTHFPDRLWYQNLLLLTYALAFVSLASGVRKTVIGKWAWTSLAVVAIPFLILNPSFTSAALCAATVGAFQSVKEEQIWRKMTAFLLILLGLSWRPIVAIPAILMLIVFTIALLARHRSIFKPRATFLRQKALSFFVSASVIALAGFSLNPATFSSTSWQEFFEYNTARSSFHDTPRRVILEAESQEIWSSAEIKQFQSWLMVDERTFGISVMKQLDASIPTVAEEIFQNYDVHILSEPSSMSRTGKVTLSANAIYFYSLAFLWAFLFFWVAKLLKPDYKFARRRETLLFFSPILILGPLFFYRLTEAIIIGLGFAALAATLLILSHNPTRRIPQIHGEKNPRSDSRLTSNIGLSSRLNHQTWLSKLQTIATVFPMIVGYWSPFIVYSLESSSGIHSRTNERIDDFKEASEWSAHNLDINTNYISSYGFSDLFMGSVWGPGAGARDFPENVMPLGWPVFSPHWDERLQELSLPPLRDENLLAGEILFIGTFREADTIASSIADRLSKPVTFQSVSRSELNNRIQIYEFKAVSPLSP